MATKLIAFAALFGLAFAYPPMYNHGANDHHARDDHHANDYHHADDDHHASEDHHVIDDHHVDQHHFQHDAPPAPYHFEYTVKDLHTHDIKTHHEVSDGHGSIKGLYSLVEPDGSTRLVEYTADHEHGFNAVVKKIGGDHDYHHGDNDHYDTVKHHPSKSFD